MMTNICCRKNVGNVGFKRASSFNLGTPDGSPNVGNVGNVGFRGGEMLTSIFSRKNVGNVGFERASLFNLGTLDGSPNASTAGYETKCRKCRCYEVFPHQPGYPRWFPKCR